MPPPTAKASPVPTEVAVLPSYAATAPVSTEVAVLAGPMKELARAVPVPTEVAVALPGMSKETAGFLSTGQSCASCAAGGHRRLW